MEEWKTIESCFGQEISSSISKNKYSQKLLHDAALFLDSFKDKSTSEELDLVSASHWIDLFLKRTALEPLAENFNKQLTELAKCLLEFEVEPEDFSCQSTLMQRVAEMMDQHHKWTALAEAKKQEIDSFIVELHQQVELIISKVEKGFREVKRSTQQMKSEAIGYRHDSTALQLKMANEMMNYRLESENAQVFDLNELNELFAIQNDLDKEIEELEGQLSQFKGILPDLNLAKVELAKVDGMLQDLSSEKEDLIYRLSIAQ
jgi:hypothetical protein